MNKMLKVMNNKFFYGFDVIFLYLIKWGFFYECE